MLWLKVLSVHHNLLNEIAWSVGRLLDFVLLLKILPTISNQHNRKHDDCCRNDAADGTLVLRGGCLSVKACL